MPRLALLHPELTVPLSPDSASALLTAVAAPPDLLALTASPLDLAQALFTARLPPAATDVLDLFAHLASEPAADAAREAAIDVGLDPRRWDHSAPPDIALDLVLGTLRHDIPLERVVARVDIRLARLLPRRVGYEYVARDPRPFDRAALARALDAVPGLLAPPWITEADDDGVLHAALLWAQRPRVGTEVTGRKIKSRTPRSFRADILRVDAATGRFTIRSKRPDRSAMIADAIACGVFADARAFTDRPVFTLRPLLTLGSKGLASAHLPAPVRRVELVACERFTSPDDRGGELGPAALDKVRAAVRTEGGYIGRATLRFTIDGVRAPVDVTIDLPNKIGMREPRFESVVRAALATLGILSPGVAGDDVTTIIGVPMPEWRVRELVGRDGFRRLVDTHVLVPEDPKKSRGLASEAMRALGYTLRTFEIDHPNDAGRLYALAADSSVRARSVGESDRAMWRLDPAGLCDRIRTDTGLVHGTPVGLPRGVADIGAIATTSGRVRVFYAMRAVLSDNEKTRVAQRIVRAARPSIAIVFVPRGRRLARDIPEVEINVLEQLGLVSWRGHLDRALANLGSEKTKGVVMATPGRVRLVLRGEVEGRRLTVLLNERVRTLQPRLFAVLMRLVARHELEPGAWTPHSELGTIKAPGVPTRIREALQDLLPAHASLIENRRGKGYRLGPEVVVAPILWGEFEEHAHLRVRQVAKERKRLERAVAGKAARPRDEATFESPPPRAPRSRRVRGAKRSSS